MAKVTWKGSTLLAPVPPVLVSCRDENADKDNLITVAWTGTLNSDPPKTYISVRPERYSHDIIKQSGEFVINLPSSHIIRSIDFCGCRRGRDMDKFAECSLTREKASTLSCPMVAESPVSIECRAVSYTHLDVYKRQILIWTSGNAAISSMKSVKILALKGCAQSKSKERFFPVTWFRCRPA